MAVEEKKNAQLYELDDCLIVPFHEDVNAGNIPVLMDESLKMMERFGLVHVILDLSSVVVMDRKTFNKTLEMANMIRMMGGMPFSREFSRESLPFWSILRWIQRAFRPLFP